MDAPEAPPHVEVGEAFAYAVPDPRRGALWTGAAPVEASAGRVALAVGGGWLATFEGLQGAGGGLALETGWSPSARIALTALVGGGAGTLREGGELGPGRAWGALVGARWLVVDAPAARVAAFLVGGAGAGGGFDGGLFGGVGGGFWQGAAGGAGTGAADAGARVAPTSVVGAGVAFEMPFYGEVVVDAAVPVGGFVLTGALPPDVPLAVGRFAPLFLLSEAGFTWRLAEDVSFRLGYVALASSWSWRWHPGAWTLDVSGQTNLLTGHLSVKLGRTF